METRSLQLLTPQAMAALEMAAQMAPPLPEPSDDTTISSSDREQAEARAWTAVMERAGIPPRPRPAHLLHNCQDWSRDPGRQKAYSMALQFGSTGRVMDRGLDRFALFLTGEFGRGKTWLATAAFKSILAKTRAGTWRKFYSLIREVQSCYTPGSGRSSDTVIERYQSTPVLMLDDVGDMERRKSETEDRTRILYEVLDYRNDYLLPTIITTNLMPDDMTIQFGERTFQRVLEMAAFAEMTGENLREVAA